MRLAAALLLELDVHERLYPCAADRARIVLHAHDLTAGLAEAEMATREHDCVLDHSEANDALTLRFTVCSSAISTIGTGVLPVHICQLKDGLVVEELLLHELEAELVALGIERQGPAAELDGLLSSASVIRGKDRFYGDDYRVEVHSRIRKLVGLELR